MPGKRGLYPLYLKVVLCGEKIILPLPVNLQVEVVIHRFARTTQESRGFEVCFRLTFQTQAAIYG